MSGQSQSGRYRMAEQGLLPKFAAAGRPVSPAAKRNSEEASAQRRGEKARSVRRAAQIETGAPKLALDLRPARTSAFAGAAIELAAAANPKLAAGRPKAIAVSRNGFPLRKSPFTAKPEETIPPRLPAQTELSLDAVKPVRNDLSDADLEVVRARREKNQPGTSTPSRLGMFKAELTGTGWSRLTARLFNSLSRY